MLLTKQLLISQYTGFSIDLLRRKLENFIIADIVDSSDKLSL